MRLLLRRDGHRGADIVLRQPPSNRHHIGTHTHNRLGQDRYWRVCLESPAANHLTLTLSVSLDLSANRSDRSEFSNKVNYCRCEMARFLHSCHWSMSMKSKRQELQTYMRIASLRAPNTSTCPSGHPPGGRGLSALSRAWLHARPAGRDCAPACLAGWTHSIFKVNCTCNQIDSNSISKSDY
jgi:hypothetical protein